jgi:nucleoside-diphosphate-sugar epimerase
MAKIVVTGASGWLGRATLRYLKDSAGLDLNNDVMCFSKNQKKIYLTPIEFVLSEPINQLNSIDDEVSGLFNFAFLTRNYAQQIGIESYIKINRQLIKNLALFLESHRPGWTVGVSSGAIYSNLTKKIETNILENPYGYLKVEEEGVLENYAAKNTATSVIGRLWGCTGLDMPLNRNYAISDFIYQALTKKTIDVTSDFEVWRRYIDDQDFIQILHEAAMSGESLKIDSAGELIEIGELANRIATLTGAKVSRPNLVESKKPNLYYPSGTEMLEFSRMRGIRLKDMGEQISLTLTGHKRQLERLH